MPLQHTLMFGPSVVTLTPTTVPSVWRLEYQYLFADEPTAMRFGRRDEVMQVVREIRMARRCTEK